MPRAPLLQHWFRRGRSLVLLLMLCIISCWEVEADLVVSTHDINFGDTQESTIVSVFNDSYDNALTSGVVTLEYKFKSDRAWLTVSPASGSAGEAERISHTVAVDRSRMVYGENLATITVSSNGGNETIRVKAVRSVPGCNDKPSALHSPAPASGTTGLEPDVVLSWDGGDSQCDPLTATYDVYFGDTTNPPFHHNNDSLKVWNPGPLVYNKWYYWRIVAKDANGSISGPEWSFRTVCNLGPTPVTLTVPADNATSVSINADLYWTGGNTQCANQSRIYDVYFGTSSPPPLVGDTESKSWDPGTLSKGTTYYWRVAANDPNGTESSSEFSFTTEQALCTSKATSVSLVSPANNATNVALTADLSWSGGESTCPGLTATYDVYFGTTSPPPFSHNNGIAKSWDAPLEYNATYFWYVIAKDANGSVVSSERMFRTPCNLPPTAPTPISPADGATNVGINDNLTWNNGNSQCSGQTAIYDVYFGTASNPPLVGSSGSSKAWEPGLLVPGVKYYWKVVAKDAFGSTSSTEHDFTVGLLPCTSGPGAVSLQSPANNATGVSIDSAELTWTGGNSQCEGLTATYDVYFGTASTPPLHHNNGSAKTWNPGALDPSTKYYWKIVAADANGTAASSTRNFTTDALPCTEGPTAVSLQSPASAATNVALTADLSWTGGNSQCNGLTATYDVYFGTVSPPPLDHNNGSAKTWDPGALQPATTYYWKIVARDANGTATSSTREFTTVCTAGPGAVTLQSPANGATDVALTADLSWTGGNSQCAGLTATYDVYFGTVSPPPLDHNNGSAKTWDPGTLEASTTYYWRVVAEDANGSSSSVERSFTTVSPACVLAPTVATISSPADGATGVSINGNIAWSGGNSQCEGLTATYDVYFGTTSPPPFDHNNGTTKTFDPGVLQNSTTYYWRIVAKDANGETAGPEWSFTTEAPCLSLPTAPSGPSPANNSTNRNENSNLAWQGGVSTCGLAVTYDVYFGTTDLLGEEHKVGTTSAKAWELPRLAKLTKYYWKVVATDANGATPGPVWNFTTRN